jgi:hypothetical protein
MEVPLALGDARALRVFFHEHVEHSAADGGVLAREKERGRTAGGALFEVALEGFDFIGLQGVDACQRALEALDAQAVVFEVEVVGM